MDMTLFSKLTTAAVSAAVLAAFLPVTALAAGENEQPEITGYASVTVNAYSSETGELFNADEVMLHLNGSVYNKEDGSIDTMDTVSRWFDMWHLDQSNPHTTESVPVCADWKYYYEATWTDYAGYRYELVSGGIDDAFTLEAGEEKTVDVYLKRVVKEGPKNGFLVYLGKTNEDAHPVFMQFYTIGDEDPDFYRVKQLTYLGEVDADAKYGDIYETNEAVATTGETGNWQLAPLDSLKRTGNVAEVCTKETYTVYSSSAADAPGKLGDTLKICISCDDDAFYDYSIKYSGLDYPFRLSDIGADDTLEFYVMGANLIVPAASYEHTPQIMGDLNGDRIFTTADVVLLEKWLCGSADESIGDWTSADYCKDGVLDTYDLIMMRQALIEELSLPHCKMSVKTTYGGYGIGGQDLGHGEFAQESIVRKGDFFVELNNGMWVRNFTSKVKRQDSTIIRITDVTAESVSFIAKEDGYRSDEKEFTLAFGDSQEIRSLHVVFDGTNYDHEVTFGGYIAPIEAE